MRSRTGVLGYQSDCWPVTANLSQPLRFGPFELDTESGELRNGGRVVRIPPQPFKLLSLLASQPGRLFTREEIRAALWSGDTFIDFEQGVNFAIKQVREALKDDAERSLYVQTVPKRGYRFIAPVQTSPLTAPDTAGREAKPPRPGTRTSLDLNLQKILWSNIAELRLAEEQRKAQMRLMMIGGAVAVAVIVLGV